MDVSVTRVLVSPTTVLITFFPALTFHRRRLNEIGFPRCDRGRERVAPNAATRWWRNHCGLARCERAYRTVVVVACNRTQFVVILADLGAIFRSQTRLCNKNRVRANLGPIIDSQPS